MKSSDASAKHQQPHPQQPPRSQQAGPQHHQPSQPVKPQTPSPARGNPARDSATHAGASAGSSALPPHLQVAAAAAASTPSSGLSAPEAILRAIQDAGRSRGADDRKAVRHHYCVPMTLHIDDPRKGATRVIRAATSNISTGGFAFIFDASLTVGSIIRASFDSLAGKPEIGGIVRSCVHICGTQHRIGVEYQ